MIPWLTPGFHNQGRPIAPHRHAAAHAEICQPRSVAPLGSDRETFPSGAGFTGLFLVAAGRWRLM